MSHFYPQDPGKPPYVRAGDAVCSDRSSDFLALLAAFPFMRLVINGLFAQSLRYAQKINLGISDICLWLFFSHALILLENPH
jgi:hypothetical protein